MNDQDRPINDLLEDVKRIAAHAETVEFGRLLDSVGQQSFAPLLLMIGLIMLVPGPADIPGVPVMLGLVVILLAAQMLIRSDHVWIPAWMEHRQLSSDRVCKMIAWLRKPARWIDSLTRPRWRWLMNHATVTILLVSAMLVAMSTPVLEFIPFSANLAGGAIVALSLSILARDGLLAVLSIGLTLSVAGLIVYQLIH